MATTTPLLPDPLAPHLREVTVSGDTLYQGHFLQLRRDHVRLPGGALATREYVLHPGAVMVIPLLDDGRVVLERQFRYPLGRVMVEFPAGKLDPGETSWHCAQRELLEETGYTAREWARAGQLHPVIAYANEFIDIWFARGLVAGVQNLDPGELVDVFAATPEALLQGCRDGEVTDAKTLTGALWLQNVLSGAWPLDWQTVPSSSHEGS